MDASSPRAANPSFAEATRTFARIGLLSFGGPAGQIALMHKILVDEKRWLDEARFLHALNYCMLLPGPEAMQLATYAGWLMHGVRGGLVAGLLFALPGAAIITVLSVLYLLFGGLPLVDGLLFGLRAAVLAIVIEALVRVSKRALKDWLAVLIAVAAFVAIAFLKLPFPVIILAAALIGAALHLASPKIGAGRANGQPATVDMPGWTQPSWSRFLSTLSVWLAIWFLPLAALHWALGSGSVYAVEAGFFSKMAVVTFGGAYAVLAYVAQQAVDIHGWLKPDEMLTGLGLAETTPGPLILVLAFVGFLGGARFSGLDPVLGGLAGAVVALWFTFVPCFLWIFAGAPYVETVRNIRFLASALAAVTAAVVGIIANLTVWFGLHVLFGSVGEWQIGIFSLPVPDLSALDFAAAAIAVAAGMALIRYKVNMIAVIAVSALAGAAWALV